MKSIFTKFVIAFMLIVLLIAGQSFLSNYFFRQNDVLEEKISQARELETFLAEREVDHHVWMTKLYNMFTGGKVPEEINTYRECNLGEWYYSYQPTDYNQAAFAKLEQPHQQLHQSSREVVNLFKEGQTEEAINLFRQETIPAVNQVQAALQEISQEEHKHVATLEEEMKVLDGNINLFLLLTAVISLILAIIISYILTQNIVKPINKVVSVTRQVQDGDLTNRVDVKRKDEIGTLALAINEMIDKLENMVINIRSESESLSEASTYLKNSAQETGQASEEIASSIMEVAEGNDDTSRQVTLLETISGRLEKGGNDLVDNLNSSYQVARKSESAAADGKTAITQAVSQLDTVNETVNFATEAIEKLNKRSMQIGEMVELIEAISSQTNLLALNAAIEAARAGDNGRGFAVVAEEVRNLAEESSEAASQITSLIEDIQSETTATVNSMDVNAKEVKKQIEIINDAGSSLDEISTLAQQTREAVGKIQEFASELQDDNKQIGEAIDSIAAVVEENAASSEEVSAFSEEQSATVEEVAASADELNNMMEKLNNLVREFKIKEQTENENDS